MSDKTEEPTPKRLQKAREDGDAGVSSFAAQSVGFLVAVAVVPPAAKALVVSSAGAIRATLAVGHPDLRIAIQALGAAGARVVFLVTPLLLAVGVVSGAANALQAGGVVAKGRLVPKLDRLNVINGLAGLFSAERLFSVVRSLLFAGLVVWVALRALGAHVADLARSADNPRATGALAGEIARGMTLTIATLGLGLGIVDLLVTRRAWMKKLRMSKDEVKREHKESEGDPELKAARERAHHEMLASASIHDVKRASVVVVNPTHLACALRYDEEEEDAPTVVASGEGDRARRIVEAAHAYGVPVVQDVPLAHALRELAIGDAIPEALYEAVAEILREAWSADDGEDPAGGAAGDGAR